MNYIKVFGDLHLTGNKIIDESIINFLKENINDADTIIFLGDLFNNFDISTKDNIFFNFLGYIKNNIFILHGNHDISRGRKWSSGIKHLTDRITIIEDYQYFDINENYRLHFKNYFKNAELKFNIKENVNNILFSHMDLDVNNPSIFMKDLDLVCNGHIHDFSIREKYINIGSVRMCAKNETKNKKYITIDLDNKELNYRLHDFQSVIDIKEVFVKDLREVNIERNTQLRVLINSYQDETDIMKKIQSLDWYDINKVDIEFINYIDKNFISKIESEVLENNGSLNLLKVFDDYLDTYSEKFKDTELNREFLKEKFKYFYEKDYEQLQNLFNIYNIKFKTLEAKNFKLFKSLKLNFQDYNPGIISIEGQNKDELKNGNPSSNESGKSNIRNCIEFVLQGEDKPLKWGEKSGYSKLNFEINGTDIIFERKFTKSGNDLRIWFDGQEKWENETTTSKEAMFYDKFKIKNSIPYILLSDTGLGKYFFSSKNSEKFRIFKEIFPIIDSIGNFVQSIKIIVDNKEKEYEKINSDKVNLLQLRKNNSYWKNYFEYDREARTNQDNQIVIMEKCLHLLPNEDILKNKDNIEYIKENLNQELYLCYNNIYKNYSNASDIFDEYDNNEILIKELNQTENLFNNNAKIVEEISNEFTNLNNKMIECKVENIITDDLNSIKNKLIILDKFNIIDNKYTKEEIESVFNLVGNLQIKGVLFNEKNILWEKLENFKNRIIEIKKELEGLNSIDCPNCGFKIVDKIREDILLHRLAETKQNGRMTKIEFDNKEKEFNDFNDKNKKAIENNNEITKILTGMSPIELKNREKYKVPVKYNLENIDNYIKLQEEQNNNIVIKKQLDKQFEELSKKLEKIRLENKKLYDKKEELKNKLGYIDNLPYNSSIFELPKSIVIS
jgi:UDP-2,3-diacylglucosamine pyrophosphatase LpxH/DNA-directed RNA polymerase subunit RPC12/RpoP